MATGGGAVVAGVPRVSADLATIPLRIDGDARSVWIRHEAMAPAALADAALVLAYSLAMALDLSCSFESPVSETLRRRVVTFGDIQRSWYEFLGTPRIVGATRSDTVRDGRGETAAFFSGGLDSFHTAILERAELDALVFVLGADIPVHEATLAAHVTARVSLAAAELGLPLVRVATNLREVTDDYAPWPMFVGPAMSAVALALAPRFDTVLYSASHGARAAAGRRTDADAIASDLVRVRRYDGAADRAAKARAVGNASSVRAHLRVCWENRGSAYNCGRCPKCVRTMVELDGAGALEGIETLPSRVDRASAHALLDRVAVEQAFRDDSVDPAPVSSEDASSEDASHGNGAAPRAVATVRRALGSVRRRVRPSRSRFAGSTPPERVVAGVDPLIVRAVDLSTRLARVLRPALAPHRAVALVGLSPQNAGDAAVWAGTLRLLERWQISVAHVSMFPELDADRLRRRLPVGPILVAGGGNLGSLYPYLQDFRDALLVAFPDRPVIQLPQSIHVDAGEEMAIAERLRAHPDLTVFVRDEPSRLRAERLGIDATLCPDMAFALAGPEWAPPPPRGNRIVWLGRDDAERGGLRPPLGADIDYVDLARRGAMSRSLDSIALRAGARLSPPAAATMRSRLSLGSAAWAWRRVGAAPAVVTERLHGHILCLLTGTPHVVLPDANGKIVDFAQTWGTLRDGVEIADDPEHALATARRLGARRVRWSP